MQVGSRVRWPFLMLMTMILAVVLLGCARADEPNPDGGAAGADVGSVEGKLAPDFTLVTLSDQEVKLSDLKGKKVVLNFWASWCGPCREEMPDLLDMSRKYEGEIAVYGVNVTAVDSPAKAQQFVMEEKMTFPVLLDLEGEVQKAYRVVNIPTSFFLDEEGRIVKRWEGGIPRERMEEMFGELAGR